MENNKNKSCIIQLPMSANASYAMFVKEHSRLNQRLLCMNQWTWVSCDTFQRQLSTIYGFRKYAWFIFFKNEDYTIRHSTISDQQTMTSKILVRGGNSLGQMLRMSESLKSDDRDAR
jgi:hypothetical protein